MENQPPEDTTNTKKNYSEREEIAIDTRRTLSLLSHASVFLGSTGVAILIPLAIILFAKDTIVIKNAKEVLNFYITCYILALVFSILVFVLIGIPLLLILLLISFIEPILAIAKISQNHSLVYRYSWTFRFL